MISQIAKLLESVQGQKLDLYNMDQTVQVFDKISLLTGDKDEQY